ncbi:MAG: hypothetical protein BRD55_10535 [Bacteroidetes bacterium SW_9_63_38]|nr:MAG: hypothetical protein BRD55_10535 [Bacteroidetes bacterium SW_9_63_38]
MTRARRSLLCVSLLLGLLWTAPAAAQSGGIGVGASIGVSNGQGFSAANPVGLAGKGWISDRHALAGMTSFFLGSDRQSSYWVIQGDYLFHNFNELEVDEGYLAVYLGAGAQFTVIEDTDNQFTIRGPVGVDYMLGSAPVDLFVEVAPTLSVTDPTSLRFDGAIGFRYFFSGE